MKISTRSIKRQDIRDDIINKPILNEIKVLEKIKESIDSINIA